MNSLFLTPELRSLRVSLRSLDSQQRDSLIEHTPDGEASLLAADWGLLAREAQLPPLGDWRTWIILAGRGYGKTRAGAEWIHAEVGAGRKRLALIGPTAADVRDVMVEGESGVLAIAPAHNRPEYQPSRRRLIWPNGAIATTYSADEPERLRGPQHDGGWCDEIAAWRYPEAWDMFQFGLRLGDDPRCVVTTTPKPTRLIRDLLTAPTTVKTGGSTYENRANLAPAFLEQIVRRFEGTRIGRQELYAEILNDTPGALWTLTQLDTLRIRSGDTPPLVRVVVAIDPAVTSNAESDETGIIVAGVSAEGHGYVLDDLSMQASPHTWASAAVAAYHRHQADRIVAEVNNGGDMVGYTLSTIDPQIPYTAVHASRGKLTRAEPIAALYEQGKVHHVGVLRDMEDQMCSWTPGDASPDRLDALVWALTELMLHPQRDWGFDDL